MGAQSYLWLSARRELAIPAFSTTRNDSVSERIWLMNLDIGSNWAVTSICFSKTFSKNTECKWFPYSQIFTREIPSSLSPPERLQRPFRKQYALKEEIRKSSSLVEET